MKDNGWVNRLRMFYQIDRDMKERQSNDKTLAKASQNTFSLNQLGTG